MKSVGLLLARHARDFVCDENGPTTTEYAAVLGLIVLVAIMTIASVGTKVEDVGEILRTRPDLAGGDFGSNATGSTTSTFFQVTVTGR